MIVTSCNLYNFQNALNFCLARMGKCRLQDVLYRGQEKASSFLTWDSCEDENEDNDENDGQFQSRNWKKRDKIKRVNITRERCFSRARSDFICATGIEDFPECPLTRDFDVGDFVKVEFDQSKGAKSKTFCQFG